MKNLKFLSFVLFAVLSVSLISCGDDDEIGGKDTLIGTWQCTWTEGYDKDLNYPKDDEVWNQAGDFTATFKEDGTAVINEDFSKWKLEGDKLSIADDDGKDEWDVYTVLKLTDSELVIEILEKDSHYEYYEKITFKKL